MQILDQFADVLQSSVPALITAVAVIVVVVVVRLVVRRQSSLSSDRRFRLQVVTLVLSLAGLVAVIMALPLSETAKGQLLSLLGILLSAAIALSSTTFVGNIMAGLMLRAVRNFRPGDFIRVADQFGRVSDLGLFHTEIQTEDRDLTTMPNLFLVTNPVKVIRSDGTVISAEVSLGYDVPHDRVEILLQQAAAHAGLDDPFVYVLDLGDYAVTYRVAGMLREVKHVLSTRSRLRQMMLDELHGAGIEIVSPTFMNQRQVGVGKTFIPDVPPEEGTGHTADQVPESIVFDKAEEAESLERVRERYEVIGHTIESLKDRIKDVSSEADRDELEAQVKQLDERRERIEALIERKQREKK